MNSPITTDGFSREQYTGTDGFSLPYRLYVPEGEGPFPVLVCLHGAGERGDDNQCQIGYFLPILADADSPARQAIVIIPQCPSEKQWVETPWDQENYTLDRVAESPQARAVMEILRQICHTYPADNARIYVTGLSMGGFGTWDLLARHGDVFSAGMPICGGGATDAAGQLARLPIRTFHGTEDPDVPCSGTQAMAKAIAACRPVDFSCTLWEGKGHAIWHDVYQNPDNIRWLFSQRKQTV